MEQIFGKFTGIVLVASLPLVIIGIISIFRLARRVVFFTRYGKIPNEDEFLIMVLSLDSENINWELLTKIAKIFLIKRDWWTAGEYIYLHHIPGDRFTIEPTNEKRIEVAKYLLREYTIQWYQKEGVVISLREVCSALQKLKEK